MNKKTNKVPSSVIVNKKKLTYSQRELLLMKSNIVQEAVNIANARQKEFQNALNIVADELGIDRVNEKWKLDEKVEYFVKQ